MNTPTAKADVEQYLRQHHLEENAFVTHLKLYKSEKADSKGEYDYTFGLQEFTFKKELYVLFKDEHEPLLPHLYYFKAGRIMKEHSIEERTWNGRQVYLFTKEYVEQMAECIDIYKTDTLPWDDDKEDRIAKQVVDAVLHPKAEEHLDTIRILLSEEEYRGYLKGRVIFHNLERQTEQAVAYRNHLSHENSI